MKMEILTKKQAQDMIKKEIEEKFKKEFDILWKYLNQLREEIKILNARK